MSAAEILNPEILNTEILVVGAGVLGLCTAVELTRRGHAVRVLDPGGPNASSVAAGMIAPAMESAIESVSLERAALLRDARALWTDFAAAAGVDLQAGPAVWRGEGADEIADRLRTLGFAVERQGDTVLAAEDVQIEPGPAMARLRAVLGNAAISGRATAVSRRGGRWRIETDDTVVEAEILVLATGAADAIPGLPDKVAKRIAGIEAIRGQIGWTHQRLTERVVRGVGVYVAPSAGGALIGATMETGRRDLDPDMARGSDLVAAASRLLGRDLAGLSIDWRVGVRGATTDGLPMAGPSGEPGLHLALAPRRNGWLLGPLVARTVADGIEGIPIEGIPIEDGPIEGGARGPHAAALDPARF